MYHIIKDGATIATVDRLAFVRMQSNGVIINCTECEAQGICVGDVFYRLPWLPHLPGAQTVTYTEFSGPAAIAELDNAVIDLTYQNILLEMEEPEHAV